MNNLRHQFRRSNRVLVAEVLAHQLERNGGVDILFRGI
jgi:hypothetical protein